MEVVRKFDYSPFQIFWEEGDRDYGDGNPIVVNIAYCLFLQKNQY